MPGTLYTTTFPCHNCARHIVAAGISKVYYIEPYEKSLALELHSDSITITGEENKVEFLQYEGMGPDKVLKLFHNSIERKDGGKARMFNKGEASPIYRQPLDGFATHEKRVLEILNDLEHDESGYSTGETE